MRLRGSWALALLACTMLACTSIGSANRSETAVDDGGMAGIDATRRQYVAAWRAANADQITALYSDDALVLYPNQPAIAGRGAIREYFGSFFKEFVQDDFQLTSAEIEVCGSWAFDRGTYRWKATTRSGGETVTDEGKYLVILRREKDGTWRVARDMDNSDRPMTQLTRGAD